MRMFFAKYKVILIIGTVLLLGASTLFIFLRIKKPVPIAAPKIAIKLLGEEIININLNEEYIELGAIVIIDNIDTTKEYEINGTVDNTKIGEYILTYKYEGITITRTVMVNDNIAPIIKLNGSANITIVEGTKYNEKGATASDNVDGDLTEKIEITGSVNTKIGKYTVTYTVADNASNKVSAQRTVNVIKKKVIKQPEPEVKEKAEATPITYANEISNMEITSSGIKVTGVNEKPITKIYLANDDKSIKQETATSLNGNNYSSALDLTTLANGTYNLYIAGDTVDELAKNNLTNLLRIKRFKLGDKLVTLNYNNNNVQVVIENHSYLYHVVIDVGHGGVQPGAVNVTHLEKDVNLTMSLYERDRYKAHGLNVLMTRTGDNPELGLGDNDWRELSRRSYAMGYYGAVSHVVYSNHHNSFPTTGRMGPEVIVPASLNKTELASEYKIISLWKSITPLTENHIRLYGRNYDTGSILNKENEAVYQYTDYYAVVRIPFKLFNVKSILFEAAYMSNAANWDWYWNQENWESISEAKIKTYVEAMGVTYIEPS